jgi:hypothetical protein
MRITGSIVLSYMQVGRVKLRIPEVINNDYDLERVWPLLGEKAQGSIKFRVIWTPAATHADA